MNSVNALTPELLSVAAGIFISIILSMLPLFPRAGNWWAEQTAAQKQAFNIVALVIVTMLVLLLSCISEIAFVACTQVGIYKLFTMFIAAVMANTATYNTGKDIFAGFFARRDVEDGRSA